MQLPVGSGVRGDGEMGRWGDGESTPVRRNTTVEGSGEPEGGDKGTRGQGDNY